LISILQVFYSIKAESYLRVGRYSFAFVYRFNISFDGYFGYFYFTNVFHTWTYGPSD